MAELFLNVGGGDAVGEEEGRKRVTQAMRAEVTREACGLQGALERLLDVTVIHRRPGLGGDYRRGLLALGLLLAVLVQLLLPLEPRLCELRLVPLEDLPEREAQVHGAAVTALRGVDLAIGRYCPLYSDLAAHQVEVTPLKPTGLAQAEARAAQEEEERIEAGELLLDGG